MRLDRIEKKVAKFANLMKNLNWEKLVQRKKIARLCSLYKAYSTEQSWEG